MQSKGYVHIRTKLHIDIQLAKITFNFSVAKFFLTFREETGRSNRESSSSLLQRYKEHKDLVSNNYFLYCESKLHLYLSYIVVLA